MERLRVFGAYRILKRFDTDVTLSAWTAIMTRQTKFVRRALVRRPLVGILGLCVCSLVAISLLAQQGLRNADEGASNPGSTSNARANELLYGHDNHGEDPSSHNQNAPKSVPAQSTYTLKNVGWQEFQRKLLEVWGSDLRARAELQDRLLRVTLPAAFPSSAQMVIDRQNNTVTLEGSAAIVAVWRKAVEVLDVAPEIDSGSVRLVNMSRAEPATVRNAAALLGIEEVAQGEVTRTMQFGPPRDTSRMRIATQPRRQDPAQDPALVDPNQDVVQDQQRPIGPVRIQILPEINSILITGDPADVERVKQIIAEIAASADQTQPEIQVVPLDNVDSNTVQGIIRQVYTDIYEARHGPASINALETPNALLVIGQPEAQRQIKALAETLDIQEVVEPGADFKIYRLKHMSARDAGLAIQTYFTGDAQQQNTTIPATDWIGAVSGPVIIIQNFRSNTLIVKADANNQAVIDQIIAGLDVEDTGAATQIRFFKLQNTLADDIAVVLQDIVNGQQDGSGQGFNQSQAGQQLQQFNQAQQGALASLPSLQLMTIDENGNKIKSTILYGVRVTAERTSNSLIVNAPEGSMNLIAKLIERLDQIPDAESQIKVFTVRNGDASLLLQMLQTLFGQAQGAGAGGAGGFQGQGAGFANLPLQNASATPGSALINLRFGVDLRSNSIIASGPAGDLQVVEDLLLRLDEDDQLARRAIVYHLSNAPAADVAAAVNAWLDRRSALAGADPTVNNPYETHRREIIVEPEPVGNRLIISATPDFFPDIIRIIEELDRRPALVKIKVLIVEVDLLKLSELGVQWGIQDSLVFDRGIGAIGFPFNQAAIGNNADAASLSTREMLAGQLLSNLGVGRFNDTLGYGGLVLTAGNESINVLIRALQERNCGRVISKPYIETIDNLQARVQVGALTARPLGSTVSANGFATADVEDTPVGVILEVTPRVSPDGMIMMAVDAIKSRISDSEGQFIPSTVGQEPIFIPNIDQITTQTTVMAKSGQTVVLSGMIEETTAHQVRGIPVLSDIPFLAPLFRFERDAKDRKEVLFILTPYLLDSEEDVALANQDEFDRMNWCLADVASVYGPIGYGEFDSQQSASQTPMTFYPHQDPLGNNPLFASESELGVNPVPSTLPAATQTPGMPWRQPVNGQWPTQPAPEAGGRLVEPMGFKTTQPAQSSTIPVVSPSGADQQLPLIVSPGQVPQALRPVPGGVQRDEPKMSAPVRIATPVREPY